MKNIKKSKNCNHLIAAYKVMSMWCRVQGVNYVDIYIMVMRGYGRETYGREKRQLRKVANEIKKGRRGWTNNWCSVCFIWGMIEN